MPSRKVPLITGEIYHIFNRGVNHRPIFIRKAEYQRALQAIKLYQPAYPPMKLSHFLVLSQNKKQKILTKANKKRLISILSFCLMPNHFHLLLRQETDNGISKFMSQFQNSFARYFNTRNNRSGPLFTGRFKAVRVETEKQLLHLSRYIHLNPYSSHIIKSIQGLSNYQFSSLLDYISLKENGVCSKKPILAHFKNKKDYKKFVFDQADYQRNLEEIKHLIIDS